MDEFQKLKGSLAGQRVACIASGPSLTLEDCEMIRAARLPTIVVNTSFRLAPWADFIFAMDDLWWKTYSAELDSVFFGKKLTFVANEFNTIPSKGRLYPPGFGNSGSYAISAMIMAGAKEIILIGYDCKFAQNDDGHGPKIKKHWHPDHPGKMGNASSIARWPYQFHLIAKHAVQKGVRIINCSRDTALTCFERGNLESELSK
jgi:hypothetical protein